MIKKSSGAWKSRRSSWIEDYKSNRLSILAVAVALGRAPIE